MNHGYSRAHTPVPKNPCLFHQYTTRTARTYYPSQPTTSSWNNSYIPAPSANAYLSSPSLYTRQSPAPSTLPYSHPFPYPYSPTPARLSAPPTIPFPSYYGPAFSYAPTVSSKGLVLVLIATLVLVALDLVIVRPQKIRSEVHYLKSADPLN